MMGPEVNMSEKFDIKMEDLPVTTVSIKKIDSTMEVPEENLVAYASNCEDHGLAGAVAEPVENPIMSCANSYEDNACHIDVPAVEFDQGMVPNGRNEDVEVDIVEDGILDEEMAAEMESPDATENSSSFGYTDSGAGAGTSGATDEEVESEMRDDNASVMEFDGLTDIFRTRKKRLTTHWRNFIRPLMWRCKWAELRIRELQSQASKYDKELAEHEKRKQRELEKCAAEEDLAIKSIPVCQNRPVSVMKRQKRKRTEETANLATYSSCHSLFSYFASKRPAVDSYMDDPRGNNERTSGSGGVGVNDELSFLELKKDHAFEDILRKIEVAQMHVHQLRLKIDKVVRENAEKFTSDNSRLAPLEQLTSCGQSSKLSLVNGRTTDQLQIGRKNDKIEYESLLCNQPVKEEPDDTEGIGTQHTGAPELAIEGNERDVRNFPDPSNLMVSQEPAAVKVRSKLTTPKNKRKRGRRKARTGRWSRRLSG